MCTTFYVFSSIYFQISCPFFPLWTTNSSLFGNILPFLDKMSHQTEFSIGGRASPSQNFGFALEDKFSIWAINSNLKFLLVNTFPLSLFTCHVIILIWHTAQTCLYVIQFTLHDFRQKYHRWFWVLDGEIEFIACITWTK